jgi:hypothetical protein
MLLPRRGSSRRPALAGCAAALLGLAACGGSGPSSPAGVPPPAARVRPALPAVPAEWATWIQANHFPIRSTSTDTNFDDLQFLKGVMGNRRLVQLGESGHGVAEFDSGKVRLIQFLHQEMGFDVIAFESGLYECFRADEQVGELVADSLMRHCINEVWPAEETLPLFDYIKAARGTGRPLSLAGFDTQFTHQFSIFTPARRTGPLHLVINVHLGWHYLYARQYDQAIAQCRRTLELDPAFPQAQRYAAWAYLQKGMHPEAIAALRATLSAVGRNPEVEGELGHALAVAGRRAEALAMLAGLKRLSSTRSRRAADAAGPRAGARFQVASVHSIAERSLMRMRFWMHGMATVDQRFGPPAVPHQRSSRSWSG